MIAVVYLPGRKGAGKEKKKEKNGSLLSRAVLFLVVAARPPEGGKERKKKKRGTCKERDLWASQEEKGEKKEDTDKRRPFTFPTSTNVGRTGC